MLDRLGLMQVEPERILAADGRSGGGMRALARRFPKARKYLSDPSPAMAREARRSRGWQRRQHFLAAWSSGLPLPSDSIGLLWSNLGLQWATDLDRVLRELHRVMVPEGLLLFSSLGPDTLSDLREALPRVYRRAPSMPLFIDMHDVGDALTRAGFDGVVMESETLDITYGDVWTLLGDLRCTGGGALLSDRPRGLTTPRHLRRLEQELPRAEGRIVARFEVVYGHAWRPEGLGKAPDPTGTARIGIEEIGRGTPARPE